MGRNDEAWRALFDRYGILEKVRRYGKYQISADQIREYREPRLMTKFDHRVNLPEIFAENSLAVLPVSRGDYVIAPFSVYQTFDESQGSERRVSVPGYLQSLAPKYLVSESIALNCAYICGILADFLEDEDLVPTVSGRMGSGTFDFQIEAAGGIQAVAVRNAQIEIDAAYEGARSLSLFEAKRDLSDDFLIRQLYYPYRAWESRVTKPVRPVFLIFSNGVFYLYEYRFENAGNYNSLRLVRQRRYLLQTGISLRDIEQILRRVPVVSEPEISFPQADSMRRIVNLIELLRERPLTRDEITGQYAFDPRQTNYYTDAGRYLGLIEKSRSRNGIVFGLSESAGRILNMDYRQRQLAIAARILSHRVFRETMKACLCGSGMPDRAAVIRVMQVSGLYRVKAPSTYFRRSSTVAGWLNWILDLIE